MTIPTEYPAGRELDALIAEKVMGIKPGRCENVDLEVVDGGMACPKCLFASIRNDREEHDTVVPRYSTSIAAAFEVAETLHDIQPRFLLEAQPFVRPRVWWCSVYGHDRVEAPTAALAICRAALLVVG